MRCSGFIRTIMRGGMVRRVLPAFQGTLAGSQLTYRDGPRPRGGIKLLVIAHALWFSTSSMGAIVSNFGSSFAPGIDASTGTFRYAATSSVLRNLGSKKSVSSAAARLRNNAA